MHIKIWEIYYSCIVKGERWLPLSFTYSNPIKNNRDHKQVSRAPNRNPCFATKKFFRIIMHPSAAAKFIFVIVKKLLIVRTHGETLAI